MARLAVLLLAGSFVLAAPAAAGPCAMRSLAPTVQTPARTALPGDGGVIVALTDNGFDDPPAKPPAWTFHAQGRTTAAGAVREVAPGLWVHALPASGAFDGFGDASRKGIDVGRASDPKPVLAAPRLVRVTATSYGSVRRGASPTRVVEATLAARPPAGAFALVTFVAGKPRTWIALRGSARSG
jgi:hypothetical protein